MTERWMTIFKEGEQQHLAKPKAERPSSSAGVEEEEPVDDSDDDGDVDITSLGGGADRLRHKRPVEAESAVLLTPSPVDGSERKRPRTAKVATSNFRDTGTEFAFCNSYLKAFFLP
jgi:hypothetical protein